MLQQNLELCSWRTLSMYAAMIPRTSTRSPVGRWTFAPGWEMMPFAVLLSPHCASNVCTNSKSRLGWATYRLRDHHSAMRPLHCKRGPSIRLYRYLWSDIYLSIVYVFVNPLEEVVHKQNISRVSVYADPIKPAREGCLVDLTLFGWWFLIEGKNNTESI